jgi:hypothetical protein
MVAPWRWQVGERRAYLVVAIVLRRVPADDRVHYSSGKLAAGSGEPYWSASNSRSRSSTSGTA